MIAVTGATGAVGGRVARHLAAAGVAQRLVVRNPAKAPQLDHAQVAQASYDDSPALHRAFHGADTVFLVSAHEARDRVGLHRGVIDAAAAAGVERIVYLSFLAAGPETTFTFGRDHYFTEEHIRASGLRFTFLRDNLYADIVPYLCGADGVIRGPAGDGAVSFVTRDDVGEVAAAVLTSQGHDGATYDLTGPESVTFAHAARELSAVTGREISYVPETLEEAYASRASYGAEPWEVDGWVTSYAAVATGELDVLSDAVAAIAGHPPRTLTAYLQAHPDDYRHLVSG